MESVINMEKNEKIIKTEIIPFPLNDSGKVSINNLDFWPVVYILLNKEKIYIGQTNDLMIVIRIFDSIEEMHNEIKKKMKKWNFLEW